MGLCPKPRQRDDPFGIPNAGILSRTRHAARPRHAPLMSRELSLRIVSAIVLAAIVLGTLVIGGRPFALVWLIAGVVLVEEWLAMTRTQPLRPVRLATILTLVALSPLLHGGAELWLLSVLGGLGFVVLLVLAARDAAGPRNAVLGLVAGLVIALVPPSLRDDPEIGIVGPAWMFAVVWSTDIAAYFTGRSLGGPKLMPRVSPNKTWSGALGGLAAATLAGLVAVLVARHYGWTGLAALPLWAVGLASALASVVSQAGDLLESALKRRYGVKDSGRLIPGHGGVMDRLDGFFTVALLVGLALLVRKALQA